MTPRRFEKINNNSIWAIIRKVIFTSSIKVLFIKVKAHSNIKWNNLADKLAKAGARSSQNITVNDSNLLIKNCFVMWDNNVPIDRSICSTINSIHNMKNFERFLSHGNNTYIKDAIDQDLVDLSWTHKWLNTCHAEGASTSRKHSQIIGKKIKLLTNTLPTTDILHRNYPKLITQTYLVSYATPLLNPTTTSGLVP